MLKKWINFSLVLGCLWALVVSLQGVQAADGNGFTSPATGEVISGMVRLRGTADAPDLVKWQVDLLRFGDEQQATYISQARRVRNNGNLGTLDTTRYPDGEHTLRLRVVHRDYNYDEYFINVTVNNADATPVANGIISPNDGITVSRAIEIAGIARHPQFQKWQVDLLPAGDTTRASLLAVADEPMAMTGTFTTLDTMTLANGPYTLRLRVVYRGGNYEEHFTTMVVDNRYQPTAANNGIINPTTGAVISGATAIRGIADDPTFRKWQLDLVNPATGDETFIGWGDEPRPTRRGLATLETIAYPDGVYQLRLRVVRGDYNYTDYFTTITIDNSSPTSPNQENATSATE